MGNLVDDLFTLVPGTFVVVAKLPPNGYPEVEARIRILNAGLDTMAMARPNTKLLVWNMHDPLSLKTDISGDGLHPTDEGYKKLGALFYGALMKASPGVWYLLSCCHVILGTSNLHDADFNF